eukprot:5097410-Pyramimonas_sp.AAC.1
MPDKRPQLHEAPLAAPRDGVDGRQRGQRAALDQHDPGQVADQDLQDVAAAPPHGQEFGQGGLQAPDPLTRHARRVAGIAQLDPTNCTCVETPVSSRRRN